MTHASAVVRDRGIVVHGRSRAAIGDQRGLIKSNPDGNVFIEKLKRGGRTLYVQAN